MLGFTVQGSNNNNKKKLTGIKEEKKIIRRNYKGIYMRYNFFYIQCTHLSLNLIIQGYKENVELIILKKKITYLYLWKKGKKRKKRKHYKIFS